MDFMLGCNYWASHAGTNMWRDWNADVVKSDLKLLSEYGVRYMRVFPIWRDFQPVKPLYGQGGAFFELRMTDDTLPTNPYYLDDVMMERFHDLCHIAGENGIKLIVGVVTGWMSSRLYTPSALYEKNLFTDPLALSLEQKFIRGFVGSLKDEPSIYAWDLGNECNCLSKAANSVEAENWTAIIANAIRAEDNSRQVVSGMHGLTVNGTWTIQDQAMHTDILTTHPYPYWVPHCADTAMRSMKTLLHATAESHMYASVGHKPCLVEEIGTMGPSICDDNTAADFLRMNLWSNWADGQLGVLWWCAHEQTMLEFPPYEWTMCERELGLLTADRKAKPVLKEIKAFADFLDKNPEALPAPRRDAVCILTKEQDSWGVGHVAYVLAKQAGINLTFCYAEDEIPEAAFYIMPSITGTMVMNKGSYELLKERIRNGATLLCSADGPFLTERDATFGLRVTDSEQAYGPVTMEVAGQPLTVIRNRLQHMEATTAKVLSVDSEGELAAAVNSYGKGTIYYLNFPLEAMLLAQPKLLEKPYYALYEMAAPACVKEKIAVSRSPEICITEHTDGKSTYLVVLNYTGADAEAPFTLDDRCEVVRVLHGAADKVAAYDASVLEVALKK